MTASDDPGWTACECGKTVPNDTRGNPYPHDCKR